MSLPADICKIPGGVTDPTLEPEKGYKHWPTGKKLKSQNEIKSTVWSHEAEAIAKPAGATEI